MASGMTVDILFGTVSGNSEMVADELAMFLIGAGIDARVHDMASFDIARLDRDALHILVSSTHGDGDIPWPAYPFFRAIRDRDVPLHGLRYAMFGLGDSNYIYSYCQGSEAIDTALRMAGGLRLGEIGRHDAARDEDPCDAAVAWAQSILPAISAQQR